MIPLPRTGQFASASQNQKIAKTEKNRLRLIMESRGAVAVSDVLDKEQRIGMRVDTSQDNWRVSSAANCSTIARLRGEAGDTRRDEKENAEACRDRSRATESRVPRGSAASVGVEGVAAAAAVTTATTTTTSTATTTIAWGGQRRKGTSTPPPLSSAAASRRLESAADAAASFNPVTVVATQRCVAAKGTVVDAAAAATTTTTTTTAPRPPRIYPASVVAPEINKEDAMEPEAKEEDERRSSTPSPEFYVRRSKRYNEDGSSEEEIKQDTSLPSSHRLPSSYRGTWPIRRDVWANQQIGFPAQQSTSLAAHNDVASVMSFSSNSAGLDCNSAESQGHRRLGAKVDVVYNLLGMLEKNGREDMSTTLLSMSTSVDSCLVMRQSGCLPLLVQLIHAPGQDPDTRDRAMQALHNVVHAKSDERASRREARVLRFLEQLRDYCQTLRISLERGQSTDDLERHPAATIAALMKLSFDEAHRHAMCQLGGLHAVAELIEMDHLAHGSECDDQNCITLRRYAGMALTNLTFGDGNNKALLCSFKEFMKALVSQLRSPSDDLRQVTASVLRNLSWRADSSSKQTLREVGAVTGLMRAAMEGRKESTLKSILSALWNLSAHCSTNKVDICAVDGALAFLVDMLSYKAPSKTLAIVENAGGILRNVSSHVAVREDYRTIVRERGCLQVLLQQLRSPSLTVVSNACGALWNLSARCPQDQRLLWDLGAVPMLRSLVHSKHKMISMGSSAALKNLLSARPGCNNLVHLDSTARGLGLSTLPSLVARRQRALEQEIDQNLAETCDNIEPSTSPTNKLDDKFSFKLDHSFLGINSAHGLRSYQLHNQQPSTSSVSSSGSRCNGVARSESRDSMRSVTSTHSDTMFERVNRHVLNGMSSTDPQIKQQSSSLHSAVGFDSSASSDGHSKATVSERRYTLRYKNAIPERLRPPDGFDMNELRCANSTISWATASNQEPSQISLHSSVENNMSPNDRSASSSSKAGSQTSVSEEAEATVCAKSDYRRAKAAAPAAAAAAAAADTSKPTSYLPEVSSTRENASFGNVYGEKALLRQHDALNSIQKAISPTISHSPNHAANSLFGDYAETDLDQPTDYSLRYGEQTIDDEKQHSGFFSSNDQGLLHEDTVRTYYTEGTPRETSLNSSRATSASDLQEDSRIRNSAKKLPAERYNKTRQAAEDSHGECQASSLTDVPKLNDFVESEAIKLNLRSATHLTDDESGNHSLPYLEGGDLDKQAEDAREDRSTVQNHSSVRTTPISMVLGTAEYNDDHDGESSSRIINLDSKAEFESQAVLASKCKVTDLPSNNVEFSSGGTSLKTSNNDSGYQVSDGDEDDEDLLAACINIGMQNNRHRHSFIGNNLEKIPRSESNLTRYQTSLALDQVEYNEITESDGSSFNIKHTKTRGATTAVENSEQCRNIPAERMREEKQDNDESRQSDNRCGKNIRLRGTDTRFDEVSLDKNEAASNKLILNDGASPKGSVAQADEEATADHQIVDNPSMKQSFARDSESSESIDSVEQSEHALLELCIQPGIKSEGNIAIDERNVDYTERPLDSYSKQIDFIKGSNVAEEICETDGNLSCKQEAASFEIVRTSDILHRDSAEKYIKEETYRRQRDPDAMIASLDRLTATLVQQTEAMRERDSNTTMKQSLTQSDTWNEDSPNDVSFPSISISAPLAASFNSDAQDHQRTGTSENNTQVENSEQTSMTESKIIQREAIKLAEAVDAEANNLQNDLETTSSLTSIDLEAIKPPSSMGSLLSLTASYAGSVDTSEVFIGNRDRCYSTSLPPVAQLRNSPPVSADSRNVRKKSLPLGVVAKRALGQGAQSHTTSLENLLNECTSTHLENVKPPSMMDELPDAGDMENSMLSVASITSEIADSREQDSHSLTGSDPVVFEMLKPVANVLSITCMRYTGEGMQSSASNSLSECLENINPPSLFNEVSEMDESTVEATTDTLCSDTLCIDTELHTDEVAVHSIVAEVIDEAENDTDEEATPISSECVSSSAESTPKKRLYKSHLTPKQKRNLTKERYRTYTIAAEIVKKEEERRKQEATGEGHNKVPRGKCSPFSKLTPKQRRQEDRARFQTQVLENPFPDLTAALINKEEARRRRRRVASDDPVEKQEVVSPTKSSIPTLTKLPVCRALRKKRGDSQESKERYRTRTLNDSEAVFKEMESCNPASNANAAAAADEGRANAHEEIHTMVQQNTLNLNESGKANKNSVAEEILRRETCIALTSNESESDRNLRMRFVNGLSKKLIGSQQAVNDDAQTPTTKHSDDEEIQCENSAGNVAREDLDYPVESAGSSDEEGSNCGDEEQQEPRETKRPRIIKPGMPGRDASADSNATDKSEPGSPKAIRGRRKALYSNPITRKPTPQSSPLKQANPVSGIPIGRSNTSPIVRATRATTLRQSNNSTSVATKDSTKIITPFTDAEKRTRNAAAMSKRASVPQKGSSLTFTKSTKRHSTPPACSSNFPNDGKLSEASVGSPFKPLERQGTFTKDEPEVENAPTVHSASASPVKTKIAKPLKGVSAKVCSAAPGKSKISVKAHQAYQPKITKANSAEKVQSPKGLPLLVAPRKVSSSGKTTSAPAKAVLSGNANAAQNGDSGKTFRKVGPLGPQRSNSNSSIISNASAAAGVGQQNRAKLAKEATSKIAGLWKKVEENKNKQRFEKPDTRQWIRPANSATEVDAAPVACSQPQAFRLFRSSTFEGISQDDSGGEMSPYKPKSKRPPVLLGSQTATGGGVKYRNSCDLTGMNASEAPCKIPVKSSESYKRDTTTQLGDTLVTLRKQQSAADFGAEATDPSKRISRLGSFIRVDPTAENGSNGARAAPASAIVPPFNYNPKPDIPPQTQIKARPPATDEGQGKFEASDCRAEIVTGSARVTTV
ncbi:Adenomatous polyposis coli protein [Harpegnathos saltator]|uniref:Adenomatous polyposis coli protein n=1 Tax=Harpegnathos saltator TaxID=610380 RepID=E2BCD3_HARSA|nr:Adenomatous polyposis coli protein [Harpegnathos saltator]